MNVELDSVFTQQDVEIALSQMSSDKSPDLNGFNAYFYKDCCHIVGSQVSSTVFSILNNGIPLHLINNTNISLIPKKNKPIYPSDFLYIALCNVI